MKTWIDLLGLGAFDRTGVSGPYIVRRGTGASRDQFTVLRRFDTGLMAMRVLSTWREEVREYNKALHAQPQEH